MIAEKLQEGKLKNAITMGTMAAASALPSFANRAEKIDPVELYSQIERHEGFRDTVYMDTHGHPTIGVGFNLDSETNRKFLDRNPEIKQKIVSKIPLSKRDVYVLYNFSLRLAYKDAVDLFPNFQKLPKDVRKVIIDMSFNLGKTRLSKFKNMRAAVAQNDFKRAANEMVDSDWYQQVGYRGKNLVAMMKSVRRG